MKTRRVFVTLELETNAELVRLNTTTWWQARLASGNDNTTCLQASANVARREALQGL